jgi:hypothetical protein
VTEHVQSPFVLVKRLEADVLRVVSQLDITYLSTDEQHTIARLKNNLIDARLEIQDYELAETREDQLRNATNSKKYLQKVRTMITSNIRNVFGAVDVAHLTAQLEQISDKLK